MVIRNPGLELLFFLSAPLTGLLLSWIACMIFKIKKIWMLITSAAFGMTMFIFVMSCSAHVVELLPGEKMRKETVLCSTEYITADGKKIHIESGGNRSFYLINSSDSTLIGTELAYFAIGETEDYKKSVFDDLQQKIFEPHSVTKLLQGFDYYPWDEIDSEINDNTTNTKKWLHYEHTRIPKVREQPKLF